MRNRRPVPWSMAMRDLRQEREQRHGGVREEPLRAAAALRGALGLTSWRGRSGRRYVAGVHPLTDAAALEVSDAVVIAVRRDGDGFARVIDAAAVGPRLTPRAKTSWAARARALGATEMHVHRLVEDEREAKAIAADLLGDESALTALAPDAPGPGR